MDLLLRLVVFVGFSLVAAIGVIVVAGLIYDAIEIFKEKDDKGRDK